MINKAGNLIRLIIIQLLFDTRSDVILHDRIQLPGDRDSESEAALLGITDSGHALAYGIRGESHIRSGAVQFEDDGIDLLASAADVFVRARSEQGALAIHGIEGYGITVDHHAIACLLYTSPSPRD